MREHRASQAERFIESNGAHQERESFGECDGVNMDLEGHGDWEGNKESKDRRAENGQGEPE